MLYRIYYLYKKAPKKLNNFFELHEIYKQVLDFGKDGCEPKMPNGTCWILHELEAMKMYLDK